ARRRPRLARLALALQHQAHPRVHPGPDVHGEGPLGPDDARAPAARAGVVDDHAPAPARRAGLLQAEEAVPLEDDAVAVAAAAGAGPGARPGPAAPAVAAQLVPGDGHVLAGAAGGLDQVHLEG